MSSHVETQALQSIRAIEAALKQIADDVRWLKRRAEASESDETLNRQDRARPKTE